MRISEVVAAQTRRLGEGRIGKMIDVGDAGLLLFGGDLKLQFNGHALELGDHHVELQQLPPLLIHLKLLQPNEVFT